MCGVVRLDLGAACDRSDRVSQRQTGHCRSVHFEIDGLFRNPKVSGQPPDRLAIRSRVDSEHDTVLSFIQVQPIDARNRKGLAHPIPPFLELEERVGSLSSDDICSWIPLASPGKAFSERRPQHGPNRRRIPHVRERNDDVIRNRIAEEASAARKRLREVPKRALFRVYGGALLAGEGPSAICMEPCRRLVLVRTRGKEGQGKHRCHARHCGESAVFRHHATS